MKDLIERLEKATGPDREMDLAIHLAIEPDGEIARLMQFRRGLDGKEGMAWDIHHGGSVVFEKYDAKGSCFFNGGCPLPRFTSSIDAARSMGGLCVFASDIGADGLPMVKLVTDTSTTPVIEYTGIGATLELAWCIAALRARADGVKG